MLISEDRLELALTTLAQSDDEYAHLKAELERASIRCKRVRQRIFLASDGTVAQRNALSEVDPESASADATYCDVLEQFEKLKARRQREEIVIDVYRTLSANLRRA
jgi:hypothetical protein